jgi:prepilin-type N-terminal cleavage/methylation domain-containing protein
MRGEWGFSLLECLLALVVAGSFLGGGAMLISTIYRMNRLADQIERATAIADEILERSRISSLTPQEFDVQDSSILYHGKVEMKPQELGTQVVVTVTWTERGTSHEVKLYTLSAR